MGSERNNMICVVAVSIAYEVVQAMSMTVGFDLSDAPRTCIRTAPSQNGLKTIPKPAFQVVGAVSNGGLERERWYWGDKIDACTHVIKIEELISSKRSVANSAPTNDWLKLFSNNLHALHRHRHWTHEMSTTILGVHTVTISKRGGSTHVAKLTQEGKSGVQILSQEEQLASQVSVAHGH